MTYKKIDKLLKAKGWYVVRVNGSHFQYSHVGIGYCVTVPNHNGKDIAKGTLRSIEKATGVTLL